MQEPFQTKMSGIVFAHIYWLLFIATLSAFSWIYFKHPMFKKYVNSSILMVSLIFIVMSAIVYMYPEFFKSTYGVAIIIFELANIFFTNDDYSGRRDQTQRLQQSLVDLH